ncbi:hypothetical protein GAU_0957 [Gemmatimonas aurantiaca T-27]|uniref:Glycoside hydrolase family 13 N-terminal domain-containing protein n=1 Tax=Gemmatimonas aurantiaca (strain DSM 14586 / JCM 11422 / NBRC 100505 / T-27) TaxID=379066 RepID=C1A6Y9_GEMAT|nr:isoamylase early set domain-containing protein [Gemmatimonas aurantiaca]BAH37999.1 hypothetical protein GAU_0957 [Gemmatimonas aurantiaca T-27]
MPDNNEQMPPALEHAIAELRREVPVRDAWREHLHSELAQLEPPSVAANGRDWRITPLTGLAAAVGFMVVGAMLGDLTRSRRAPDEGARSTHLTTATSAATMGVRFAVMAPGVQRVSLVGDFNGWDADATPLVLSPDGSTWTTMLPLSAGRHTYAFVIDGQIVRDPVAPAEAEEDFGMPNSVVLVSSRE